MPTYTVKRGSLMLPKKGDESARVVREGQQVELDAKTAERVLGYGGVELEETGKSETKSETKSEDDKPATTRGRGAAKPADS